MFALLYIKSTKEESNDFFFKFLIAFSFVLLLIVSSYEGETLTLMKISRLDMGVYICSASNGIPPAASRRIAVNINCIKLSLKTIIILSNFIFNWIYFTVNPVVNVPNQLIWSPLGNNFTMECNVEAYPRSVNYWIRGDGIY